MSSSFSIAHVDPKIRSEATKFMLPAVVINLLPLGLGFLISLFTEGVWPAFKDVFLAGELYFYAMSFCAFFFVTAQYDLHVANRGLRLWSSMFAICCCALMSFYVARSNAHLDSSESIFYGITSIIFLAVAIFINHRVLVLTKQLPKFPEETHREKVQELVDSLNEEPNYD